MKRPGDLPARLAVAAVGIPVVFGGLWLGGWPLGALVAAVAAVGAWEFYELVKLRGERPFVVLGMAAAAAVVLLATARPDFPDFAAAVLLLLLLLVGIVLALSLVLRWPGGSPTGALSSTLAGVLYVGLPLSFLPLLRHLGGPEAGGSPWSALGFVLLPLLVTWAGDTSAYFVGIAIGRVRLAPSISPKKSVEGALAGIVGGVAAAALVAHLWLADLPRHAVPLVTAAWMGAVISVGAQVGDLVESVLKREAGVKDSSGLLPGHGGFLDRLDALLWAFPLAWILLAVTGVLG